MRFKDFLLEHDDDDDPEMNNGEDHSAMSKIGDDIKPFLQRSGRRGLLYRGVNRLGSFEGRIDLDGVIIPYYRKAVRKDREPMSTIPELSKIYDDFFEDKVGFKARSQGVFCCGEGGRRTAEGYGGNACVMLPIGKFSYVWSPQVDDLYSDIGEEEFVGRGRLLPEFEGKAGRKKIMDRLGELGYTMNHLDQAIQSTSEIVVDCDEVYLIPYYNGRQNTLKALHRALGVNDSPL